VQILLALEQINNVQIQQQDACEWVYKITCKNCNKTYSGENTELLGYGCRYNNKKMMWERTLEASVNPPQQSKTSLQSQTSHFSQPRHILAPGQGDQQKKQQDGPIDQGSDTNRGGTRQVDETWRGFLSTSTHLWLLTVCRSDTWWTVISKAAENVNNNLKRGCKTVVLSMNLHNLISYCFNLKVYSKKMFRCSLI